MKDAEIRVLIVDDQAMIRTGFTALLDAHEGITVVGDVADGADVPAAVAALRPDIVLMDIRMPGVDGLTATRRLLHSGGSPMADAVGGALGVSAAAQAGNSVAEPDVSGLPRVIILTTFDLDSYVYEALRAGASGFLLKDATAQQLVEAVRVVAAGEALLSPSVTRTLIEDYVRQTTPTASIPTMASGMAGQPDTLAQPAASGMEHSTGPLPEILRQLTPRELEILELMARGMSNGQIAGHLYVSEHTVKTHVSRVLTKLGQRDRVGAVIIAYETGLALRARNL